MVKKIIVDVNILKREKIELIKKSNIKSKIGKTLKFYATETLLKQRLPFLYKNNLYEDYNYYVDFIKEYCENNIIDAASEVIEKELKSGFKWTQIYSAAKVKDIYYYNDKDNKIYEYDVEQSHIFKINTTNNLQTFFDELKDDIKVYNVIMWKKYCYKFIYKYDFAVNEMNIFLHNQKEFDQNTFISLLRFWWRCSNVASVLYRFDLEKTSLRDFRKIVNYEIPKNSFAYRKFKADDFLIDYCLIQGKKVDKDTPNDTTYIAHMNNFDILLTDDGKTHDSFMKACFKHIYDDTKDKKIMNLDEFLKEFCQ